MIGPRIGVVVGPRIGVAVGVSEDEIGGGGADPLAGVTRDATSNKYAPANATEWAAVLAVAGISSGGPSLLWNCQEASGNLADSIGTFTGTVTGTPIAYQQAVAGWSRFGISGGEAGTAVVESTAGTLPNPVTQAVLLLSYATITATPAATRVMQVTGNANQTIARFNTTPRLQGVSGGNVATGTVSPVGGVRPYVTLYDVTNNRVLVASDQEKLAPVRAAMTGQRHRLAFDFVGSILYHAAFFAAAAELSDAQVKTLLQTLGFTIPWS